MKTKILFQLFLLTTLGIVYITMSSDVNGRAMSGTSCGSCHGSQNSATTVLLSGLPASYVPGQTYPLTFTVTNSTNAYAGCNIAATAGTFSAGTGTKIKSSQITHTSPQAAVSNTTTFTCTWTAPLTGASVTINAVGNAVNNDGNASSADQWNTTTVTLSGAWPAAVNNTIETSYVHCYPNPALDYLTVEGINGDVKNIFLYSLLGQSTKPKFSVEAKTIKIDCRNLSSGLYFLNTIVDGKTMKTSFLKN